MTVSGICRRVGGSTKLERLKLGEIKMSDGHKGGESEQRFTLVRSTASLSIVSVKEFMIGKVKNGGACNGAGLFKKRMARRTRGERRTDRTTPAQGKKRSGGGGGGQNQQQQAPANLFIYSYFPNHIMSAHVERLDPNKTVLFICDIQLKFSESFFPTGTLACVLTTSCRRCNLRFRRGGRDRKQDAQDSKGGRRPPFQSDIHSIDTPLL